MSTTNPFAPIGTSSTSESEPTKPKAPANPFAPLKPGESAIPSRGMDTKLIFPSVQVNDSLESYASYGVPLNPLLNLDEERARRQSTSEKWANGAAKMFTTAGAAFLDGTIGTVVGLGNLAIGGSFFDNPFGRAVDDFNEWTQKELPNYYTQEEMSAKGLSALGYANFWADKTLNGIGYMAGNIASTAVGLGAIKIGSTALKAYRLGKAAATGTQASKAFGMGARITTKGINVAKTAGIGALSAVSEASVEARQALRSAEERLTQEAMDEMGLTAGQLPDWKKKEIKEQATNEGNIAFWLNTAVVGGSNLLTFGNILLPRYLQFRSGVSGINRAARGAKWADEVASMPMWARKSIALAKPVAGGQVTESWQEGMQYAIQETAPDMAAADGFFEMIKTLGEGYIDAFGSKEGLDSMMVGAIVGMLGGGGKGVQNVLQMKNQDATRARLLGYLNNSNLFNIVERAEQSQESARLSAQMINALERGDHKTYRDRQMDLLINEAIQFENAGRMDLFQERLEDELEKSDEEFKASWGIPDNVNFDKTKIITGIKDDLRKFQRIKETIDARHPDIEPYNFPVKKFKSEEEAADRLLQIQAQRAYKNLLYKTAFKLEDIDNRVEKIGIELGEMSGTSLLDAVTGVPIDTELKSIDQEKALKIHEAIEDARQKVLEKKPQNLPEFSEKAEDLITLIRDRADAIIALNNLNGSPEEQAAYLQMKEAEVQRKAQEERNSRAMEFATNAKSSTEIEDYISELTEDTMISPEARQALADKQRELRAEELAFEVSTDYKSVAELEKDLASEEDPIKIEVLKEIIERRKATGQTDPIKTEPAPSSNEGADAAKPKKSSAEEDTTDDQDPSQTTNLSDLTGGNEVDLTPEDGTDMASLLNQEELQKEALEKEGVAAQVKALFASRGLELSDDQQNYVRKDKAGNVIETYSRVSDLKFEIETNFPEAMAKSAARGTIIDDMLRYTLNYFNTNGKFPKREDLKGIYNASEYKDQTEKFTDKFITETYNFFVNFVKSQKDLGYVLLTDIPPVFGEINGKKVAGTVDILAYNPKTGDVKVMDLKTAGKSRKRYYKETIVKNGEVQSKYSYEINDAIQLAAYTELINQMVGLVASRPYIVPLIVRKSLGEYYSAAGEKTYSKNTKKNRYTLHNTKITEARQLLGIIDKSPVSEEESIQDAAEEELRQDPDVIVGEELDEEAQDYLDMLDEQYEPMDPTDTVVTSWGAKKKTTVQERRGPKTSTSLSIANGEIQTVEINGVPQALVDDNGNFVKGNDVNQQLPNGSPLNIDRDIIKNTPKEELVNATVEFEFIKTKWQVETEEQSKRPVSDSKVPIGVFLALNGKKHLIGVLAAANFNSPAELIESRTQLAQQLKKGEKVFGRITNVHAGNLINTYNKAGKKVFFPIKEAIGKAGAFLSTGTTRGNMWTVQYMEEMPALKAVKNTLDGMNVNSAIGRIVAVVERPGHPEKTGVIPAYTATMDNKAVSAVMTMLSRTTDTRNIADDIKEIVGLPADPKLDSVFYITDHERFADAVVYFKHKDGYVIRMANDQFAKMMRGEKDYKFSAGNFDFKRTERPEGYEKIISIKHTEDQLQVGIKLSSQNFILGWEVGKSIPTVYKGQADSDGNLVPMPKVSENNIRQVLGYIPAKMRSQIEQWIQAAPESREAIAQDIYEGAELFEGDSIVYDTYGPKIVWENTMNKRFNGTNAKKLVSIELNKLRENLQSSFKDSLLTQRRQVDLTAAFLSGTAEEAQDSQYQSRVTGKVYETYLDYLSSPEELEKPQSDKTSILTMDTKSHRGSFYFDLKVEFSTFERENTASRTDTVHREKDNTQETEMDSTPNRGKGDIVDPGFRSSRKRKKPGRKDLGEEISKECKGN